MLTLDIKYAHVDKRIIDALFLRILYVIYAYTHFNNTHVTIILSLPVTLNRHQTPNPRPSSTGVQKPGRPYSDYADPKVLTDFVVSEYLHESFFVQSLVNPYEV